MVVLSHPDENNRVKIAPVGPKDIHPQGSITSPASNYGIMGIKTISLSKPLAIDPKRLKAGGLPALSRKNFTKLVNDISKLWLKLLDVE